MNTLQTERVASLLEKLHQHAAAADHSFIEATMAQVAVSGVTLEHLIAEKLAEERLDYRAIYRGHADHFLSISPGFGCFLYMLARAQKATRIVEFGTSMGLSTIYLAAAVRDNGGGQVIGSELEPGKVMRARANLAAAGLADLVEIREGDALMTFADLGGDVDMLLLDGAFTLYLPVLKLVEPRLRPGATVLGENAFEPRYRDYVRDPTNGYLSHPLPLDEGRGNEFTVRIV